MSSSNSRTAHGFSALSATMGTGLGTHLHVKIPDRLQPLCNQVGVPRAACPLTGARLVHTGPGVRTGDLVLGNCAPVETYGSPQHCMLANVRGPPAPPAVRCPRLS